MTPATATATAGQGDGHAVLIGEGDFSFARALGRLGGVGGGVITATELGDPADVDGRYFGGAHGTTLAARAGELSHLGINMVLGVDAISLECNDTPVHRWCPETAGFVQSRLWLVPPESPPASRFVFNFPHTTRPGKMAKLLRQFFRSVRACVAHGFARSDCLVVMRLLDDSSQRVVRSRYGHEEAAAAAGFDLVSVAPADLSSLERMGYEHLSTKHKALAGVHAPAREWMWQAAPVSCPSLQPLPEGCRRDVFFVAEELLERELREHVSWNGRVFVPHYLVRWRGHGGRDDAGGLGECTWERAGDVDLELRRAFDRGLVGTGAHAQS